MLRSSIALSLLLPAPALLAAQHPLDGGPTRTMPWSAGTPLRAVHGDFTGDLVADVVFLLDGGGATLVYGPAYYEAYVSLPADVRDAARLPRRPGGAAAELLILDDTGLVLLTDYDAGSFTATTIATGGAWGGATRLVAGDADGDGSFDAVGLGSDGRTVLFTTDARLPCAGPMSFVLPHDVLDLAVVDWSPAPAIAALTTGGLYVRAHDGTPIAQYVGGSFAAGALATLRQAGQAAARLAAVYCVPANGDWVAVVDATSPGPLMPFGTLDAYGIASGDVDGDARDDLVVVHRTNHYAGLLRANGAGGFTAELLDQGPGSLPAPAQSAFPVLADLTNDGDVDLLVHVAATAQLALIENELQLASLLAPVVTGGLYSYSDLQQEGDLELYVSQPAGLAFDPDAIELVLWTSDTVGGPVDPAALHHRIFALDANDEVTTTFPIVEPEAKTSKLYHVELRAVDVDQGAVVEVGPTIFWTFTTSPDAKDALELAYGAVGVPIDFYSVDEERELTLAELGERVLTPSGIPISSPVGPFDEPPDRFED